MQLRALILMLIGLSFVSACQPVTDAALWSDVAKRPPDAKIGTVKAIAADRPFADWVLYMDRACDQFGCPE
jgi:hypothetical protein